MKMHTQYTAVPLLKCGPDANLLFSPLECLHLENSWLDLVIHLRDPRSKTDKERQAELWRASSTSQGTVYLWVRRLVLNNVYGSKHEHKLSLFTCSTFNNHNHKHKFNVFCLLKKWEERNYHQFLRKVDVHRDRGKGTRKYPNEVQVNHSKKHRE